MSQQSHSLTLVPRWVACVLFAAALSIIWQSSALGNLLGGEDPLSPEVAFVPSITETTATHITVEFNIEDGYYLYRDKLKFNAKVAASASQPLDELITSSPVEIQNPRFPAAKILDDEFFGEMAIYRNAVAIDIPYTASTSVNGGTLDITYQGCADIGLCYPPTKAKVDFTLPVAQTTDASLSVLAGLNTLASGTETRQSSLASPVTSPDNELNIFGESSRSNTWCNNFVCHS